MEGSARGAAGSLFALLLALPLAAQSAARIELAPVVGCLVPLNAPGAVAPAGGTWYLRLDRVEAAPAVGLSADVRWPGSRLGARAQVVYALAADGSGEFTCYPGAVCPAVLLRTDATVTGWVAAGDLVLTLSSAERRVRPFVLAGGGLRSWHYHWAGGAVLVGAGDYSDRALAFHGGAGLELDVAGASLLLEISDYWTGAGERLGGRVREQVAGVHREARHDLHIGLAWHLFHF